MIGAWAKIASANTGRALIIALAEAALYYLGHGKSNKLAAGAVLVHNSNTAVA
jgi:hypothetical protein